MSSAAEALAGLPLPNVVFIGGGLSRDMLDHLTAPLAKGTRLVANAVTPGESEALLAMAQARLGGTLLRNEMAKVAPLGSKRGWKASYPVVQWAGASVDRLRGALARAADSHLPDCLATAEDKAMAPAFQKLLAETGLPFHAVSATDLAHRPAALPAAWRSPQALPPQAPARG